MTAKFKMSEMKCDMKIGPFWVKATYQDNKLRIIPQSGVGHDLDKSLISDFIDNLKDVIIKYESDPTSGIMSDGAGD